MKLTDVINEKVNKNEIPNVYEAALYQYAVYLNRQLTLEEIECFEVVDNDDIDVIKLIIANRIAQIKYKYMIEYDADYDMYLARIFDEENSKTRPYGIGNTPEMAMLNLQNSIEGHLDLLLELNLKLTFSKMIEGIESDQNKLPFRQRKFQEEFKFHRCSFCGKPEYDVEVLVEANEETYICDKCIDELEDLIRHS